MINNNKIFMGIDPTGGKYPLTYSILDDQCSLKDSGYGDLDGIIKIVKSYKEIICAINGPQNPNHGLVKQDLLSRNLLPGQMRRGGLRQAELILRDRSISISATPAKKELCSEWMQLCFRLFTELNNLGFSKFPENNHHGQYIETNAHAAFCLLLEGNPLLKPTLEGRIQRQLILYDANLDISNPMVFFEEITHHKLLKGMLPFDLIYSPEQLDSLMAGYLAYLAGVDPGKIMMLGDYKEGQITLPAVELKNKY